MIIFETYEARKKQTLSKDDIRDILAWDGSEKDALTTLNITKTQFEYVRSHYNAETLGLDYRRNLNTISYE